MFLNKIVEYAKSPKTKYRIVSDGIVWHLQYKEETTFFSIFKIQSWKYVWRPYADVNGSRLMDACGYKTYICSYNCVLTDFVHQWEDINDYFSWAAVEQKKLEKVRQQSLRLQKDNKAYNESLACFS